jgi:seryl-tRNA synthetase
MIDLGLLRKDTQSVIELLSKKDPHYNAQKLYDLDAQVRTIRTQVEESRHKKNELADQAKHGVTPELREESRTVGANLKQYESELARLEQEFQEQYLCCPNIPAPDLPIGNKEANKPVKIVGTKPTFNFAVKNHVELGKLHNWFDFEAAAIMTGSNFALYKGDAVRLLYSLTMLMLKNNMDHGFEPILPPYLVNAASLEIASNFPKFKEQVYAMPEDHLYLTPTAEVNLTNLYRKHIFAANELPVRMTSWTSCFRREAGAYGATERGLIRIHQFEKVELYTLCEPDHATAEQERMLACAEGILQKLGLHYRISLLAMQDCSFPSAKTYDIEVWMPGQQAYYEVSSVSNCTDFQARRGLIRYRPTADKKPELVYTLNGSSLALPRLMVALMETYQQADGSIALPEIVKKSGLWC